MAFEKEPAVGPDQVMAVLRLAGRRVPPPEDCARRVHTAVHAQWRRTVRARRLRRAAMWTGLATAAAGAAWMALDLRPPLTRQAPRALPPVASPALAKVERLAGRVRRAGAVPDARPLVAGAEIAAGAVLESGSEGRAALRLQGGSSLRIDSDTRVRLMSAAELVLEQGAVYVDGEPGRQPAGLTVRTRFGSVRERGTQFEVRLAPKALRVRVREGRIVLDHGAGAEEGSPGEELRLEDGRVFRRQVPTHGSEWSWVEQIAPAFELEGESLGRFLSWVSRETGRPLRLAGGDAGQGDARCRLHGSIAGLTPQEALAAVLPTCGRTHWYSRGAIVVGRRAAGEAVGGRTP